MNDEAILVTGSAGLIGRHVVVRLRTKTPRILRFDLREEAPYRACDLHSEAELSAAIRKVTGIVHLAAVSRVAASENDPGACWQTNVGATKRILDLALSSPRRPWLIYASSREVYGEQCLFPVRESAPLQPLNIYGRSKVEGERLVGMAREAGLPAAILRFSNVYGDVSDYADRVVPAFALAAASRGTLKLRGADKVLDFTHVDDVAEGVARVVDVFRERRESLPTTHFASGIGTRLGELAELAADTGTARAMIVEAPVSHSDVQCFYGDPSRAAALFGWRSRITIKEGLAALIKAYAERSPHKDINRLQYVD